MRIFMFLPSKIDLSGVESLFFGRKTQNRGEYVGKYGEMPIPTGQRRKLKKYKRRTR